MTVIETPSIELSINNKWIAFISLPFYQNFSMEITTPPKNSATFGDPVALTIGGEVITTLPRKEHYGYSRNPLVFFISASIPYSTDSEAIIPDKSQVVNSFFE